MITSILNITYRDNTSNRLTTFIPSTSSKQCILLLPAMGVRASYYQPLAESLCKNNTIIITADFRGQGHSSIRPSKKINFGYEDYILDLNEIVDLIKKEFSDKKIILMGHSLGGQISALYMSRFPKKVDHLILVSSCSVYYKGWDGLSQLKILLACNLFYPISQLVGHFPGNTIGFGGKEARNTLKDWSLNGRTGQYKPVNTDFNYEAALKNTKINLLAISLETDNLAPKKAVENLYKKFNSSSNIQHIHISKKEAKLSHFNWVKKGEPILSKIKEWLVIGNW